MLRLFQQILRIPRKGHYLKDYKPKEEEEKKNKENNNRWIQFYDGYDFRCCALAGDHLFWKLLFTWLSLVVSMVMSFCAVLFPTRCLG